MEWLAWHPRGDVLLAGSDDFTAWMWNASSGACMQVAPCLLDQVRRSGARLLALWVFTRATERDFFGVMQVRSAC